jgi:hypothetical protein
LDRNIIKARNLDARQIKTSFIPVGIESHQKKSDDVGDKVSLETAGRATPANPQ